MRAPLVAFPSRVQGPEEAHDHVKSPCVEETVPVCFSPLPLANDTLEHILSPRLFESTVTCDPGVCYFPGDQHVFLVLRVH